MTELADALIAAGDAGDVADSLVDLAVFFHLGPHHFDQTPTEINLSTILAAPSIRCLVPKPKP